MTGTWGSVARLAAFAALASFAAAHWATLVEAPPAGRIAVAVAIAVAWAALLELTGRLRLPRGAAWGLAAAGGLVATGLAVAAIGIPVGMLWPAGWGELGSRIDFGLTGLTGDIEYPYAGGNEWSRLAILAVAPLGLGVAATIAFWPAGGRGRRERRLAGLAIAIALYVTAVAANPPDAQLARGAVLLALIAAWMWLPALRRREGRVAVALVAAAGALAVPAAAGLSNDNPWLDYKSWTLGSPDGATFRWEHSYGPLDWERDGTRMLTVESDAAQYWRTVVLDRFDGVRWTRSPDSDAGSQIVESGERIDADPGQSGPLNPDWMGRVTIAIGELESEIVVAPGSPRRFDGLDTVLTAPDGTTVVQEEALEPGDTYRVISYVPDPKADEMRAAPEHYPPSLIRYTQIELPEQPAGDTNAAREAPDPVTVPLRGEPREPDVERILDGSPYAQMRELAHQLADGAPTAYDAVRAIQDHLRNNYEYSELVPTRTHPLAAFLLQDRRGYCQQFSGAMSLMLRMVGIPSRVAGGFAPGAREDGSGPFRVEDFDAHSWVEVYFDEIGWVAFDPTPSSAPASSQQIPGYPTADSASGGGPDEGGAGPDQEDPEEATPAAGAPGGGGGSADPRSLLAVPSILLAALLLAATLVAARSSRHRRLPPGIAAEAQLGELARALERFGWDSSGGATLLSLEGRLRRSRRPAVARYLARLRALRYQGASGELPTLAERRAMRHDLGSARGVGGRLRALLAIPPGGPRIRRPGGAA